MQIGLTKKLADYTGIRIASTDVTADPLFSWSANLLTINRRKTIVCMNDASRFAFILHGIKAAYVKKLDQLILQGIKQLMLLEGIGPDIVEQYLFHESADLAAPRISYTKTSNRKAVAALNKVCSNVEFLGARETDVFPSAMQGTGLNRMGFSVDDRWVYPCELFIGQLKERYGGHVIQTEAAELTVTLDLDGSEAVRRLIVPTFFTFAELHQLIQTVYCWQDYHLHEFVLPQDEYGRPTELIVPRADELEGTENYRLEADVRLSEVFCADKMSGNGVITYLYDFGDGWKHIIRCEQIIKDYNENYAQCIHMEGDAPPEDVGGPGGFQNMLDILQDEGHPEHEHTKAWALGMRWRPLAEGDLEKRNRALARRHYGHHLY